MTKALATALIVDPLKMVGGLWARRELIGQFTRRNIELRHRGSRLGAFWALINPLSMLVLYYIVFGVIYETKFNVLPGETDRTGHTPEALGSAAAELASATARWAALTPGDTWTLDWTAQARPGRSDHRPRRRGR